MSQRGLRTKWPISNFSRRRSRRRDFDLSASPTIIALDPTSGTRVRPRARRAALGLLTLSLLVSPSGPWVAYAQVIESDDTPSITAAVPSLTAPSSDAGPALLDRDLYEPFQPKTPRSVDDAKRIESKKLCVVGYTHLTRKELHAAYQAFRKSVDIDPKNGPALRELAHLAIQLNHLKDADDYLRRALELSPDDYELLQIFGERQVELGHVDRGIEALERAARSPTMKQRDGVAYFDLRVQLADLYERVQKPDGIIKSLSELIQIIENPHQYSLDENAQRLIERQRIRYYEKLGRAYKDAKRFDDAIKVLERGRDADPRGVRLAVVLAEAQLDKGDADKALHQLDVYLRTQPQDEAALALYERILTKLDRGKELLPSLEKLVERDGYNPVLRRFYGQKLMEKKQYAKAKEQLEKIRDRAETLPLLARLYREMNDPKDFLESLKPDSFRTPQGEQALRVLLQTLAQDPSFLIKVAEVARKQAADKPGPQYFAADFVIARAAVEAKNIDLAREFYQRCVNDRPDLTPPYIEMIDLLYGNKRFAELVEFCREATRKRPDEFEFHDYLARGLALQGKTDEAVAAINSLIEKQQDKETLVNAQMALAWIYQNAKNWDKAIAACRRVIDDFPGARRIPYARYLLSNIYTLGGQLDKAQVELKKLVDADPDSLPTGIVAAANNDLGYLWADEGRDLERAEEMIRRAVSIDPGNGAYLDSLGWVLFKRKKFAEAAEFLQKAVDSQDKASGGESEADAVIHDHLGDALLQLDKGPAARNAWEKALELYKKDAREKDGDKPKQLRKKLDLLKDRLKKNDG